MKLETRAGATLTDCRLCAILGKDAAADAFDSVWLSSQDYKALVSVGSMVPGWTLICPVTHEVNLGNRYGDPRFHEFVRETLGILQQRYGQCAVFEHGAQHEDSLTGCGVGHAHLHLVPLCMPLAVESLRFAPEFEWIACSIADVGELTGGREYLFVANEYSGPGTHGLLAKIDIPVSQFFRRVIACRLGLAEFYDYKKFPMLDIAESSARELRAIVATNAGA